MSFIANHNSLSEAETAATLLKFKADSVAEEENPAKTKKASTTLITQKAKTASGTTTPVSTPTLTADRSQSGFRRHAFLLDSTGKIISPGAAPSTRDNVVYAQGTTQVQGGGFLTTTGAPTVLTRDTSMYRTLSTDTPYLPPNHAGAVPLFSKSAPMVGREFRKKLITGPPQRMQAPANPPVRRIEVEKALLSKPQRGRKRSNLNEQERLELTRTRNREHAKSTRIRKKARYQELEDIEKKYLLLQDEETLDDQRRQCVLDFVNLRNQMLQNATQASCHDTDTKLLTDLLEDGAAMHSNASSEVGVSDHLQCLDSVIATQFLGEYKPALAFKTDGLLEDSIAFTQKGTALVEMDLEDTQNGTTIVSCLLKLQFPQDSSKIRSIDISFLSSRPFAGNADQLGKELEEQVSHPSVVSLQDAEKDREAAQKSPTTSILPGGASLT